MKSSSFYLTRNLLLHLFRLAANSLTHYLSRLDIPTGPLQTKIQEKAMDIGSQAVNYISAFILGSIQNLSQQSIGLLIMYFLLYYLLTGEDSTFVHKIYAAIPFNKENSATLLEEFGKIVWTTLISSGAIALFQGAILTITFLIFDIRGAFLWGALAAIFSFLPVLGAPLIWVPATIVQLTPGGLHCRNSYPFRRDIYKCDRQFSQAHYPEQSWRNPSFCIPARDCHRSIPFRIDRNCYRSPSALLLHSDRGNVFKRVSFSEGVKFAD